MNNEIKTWDDLCNHPDTSPTDIGFVNDFEMMIEAYGQSYTASAISALALLKIRLLIAEAYGGNPFPCDTIKKTCFVLAVRCSVKKPFFAGCEYIVPKRLDYRLDMEQGFNGIHPIAFHTLSQASEFLLHKSNVQLVKDYYMLEYLDELRIWN